MKQNKNTQYDEKILSQEDYQKLLGYKRDWANATTDAARTAAHRNAEALRSSYGYSMGSDGATFSLLSSMGGVSDRTGAGLLGMQKGPKSYTDQIEALLKQLQNRETFSYDPNTDPTYQQLQGMYQQQGQQAMTDPLAQAASLTGGYGSSYAQTAGQQAYQASLQELAAQIPDLYALAQKTYQMEGEALQDQADVLTGLQQDALDEYQSELDYWMGLASAEQRAAENAGSAQSAAQRTAWDQAMDSIALGVVPGADVLAAAGISAAWAQAMANAAKYKLYK